MLVDNKQHTVLHVPADHEGQAVETFIRDVEAAIARGAMDIALDCSSLALVASANVNVLWQVYVRCSAVGAKVSLRKPPRGLVRVLQVLDLADLFGCEAVDMLHTAKIRVAASATTSAREGYSDEFLTDVDSVNEAIERFLAYLRDLAVPEKTSFELRTIFYEVATNIRVHGIAGDKDVIVFCARPQDSRITMTFADSGVPFDITRQGTDFDPQKAAKSHQKRGFGITLTKRLADNISYSRKNGAINVLTIEAGTGI